MMSKGDINIKKLKIIFLKWHLKCAFLSDYSHITVYLCRILIVSILFFYVTNVSEFMNSFERGSNQIRCKKWCYSCFSCKNFFFY